MAQITLNSSGVASNGALVLQSNGTTTAVTINTSQGVEFNAGTAAAPSITKTGDTNTGIFFPAADTIAFAEGGAEAMRIDSAGNVGIGTSSPTLGLSVQKDNGSGYVASFRKSASDPALTIQTTGGVTQIQGLNSAFTDVSNIAMQVSGGNVGVGTSSPERSLDVRRASAAGEVGAFISNTASSTTGNTSSLWFGTWGSASTTNIYNAKISAINMEGGNARSDLAFFTYNGAGSSSGVLERARIDSSGNLLVGKTANNQTSPGIMFGLQENGAAPLSDWVKTFSGTVSSIRNWHNGTYVGGVDFSNTATSFPTSSDLRLKKDVTEAPSASAKIDQIRVVSHGWVHDDAVVEFGVIAQELYEVAEQAVTPGDDGLEVERTWTVDYSKLVPMLIKAHQEQQAIIESLKARLDAANL